MNQEFSFNFDIQENILKVSFSCNESISEKCKITLYDNIYKAILYSYEVENIQAEVVYYFIPSTTCVYVCSKNLILKIEKENIQILFEKDFQISDKIDLKLLEKFTDIFKYKDQNLYLTLVSQIFILKIYEKFSINIEKNDIVVDIGANFGIFTYSAYYKGASKIYVCEPNPKLFAILEKHFINYKNIYLDNCAISKECDYLDFILVNEILNNSDGQRNCLKKYCENVQLSEKDYDKTVKVKAKSFMDFILSNKIHKIDLLKIDCEGGEYDILNEDNAHYIKNNVDKIIVEYHNYADQIIDFANKNNFVILNEVEKQVNCELLFLKNKNEPCK